MKIAVTYEIPNGEYCSYEIGFSPQGYRITDITHCIFRSNTYLPDEDRDKFIELKEQGKLDEARALLTCKCTLFNKRLKLLNDDWQPIKCDECKSRAYYD